MPGLPSAYLMLGHCQRQAGLIPMLGHCQHQAEAR